MNERKKTSKRASSVELPGTRVGASASKQAATEEQLAMRQLLEEARQSVRRLVKREAAAELVTEEVLSFRLSRA